MCNRVTYYRMAQRILEWNVTYPGVKTGIRFSALHTARNWLPILCDSVNASGPNCPTSYKRRARRPQNQSKTSSEMNACSTGARANRGSTSNSYLCITVKKALRSHNPLRKLCYFCSTRQSCLKLKMVLVFVQNLKRNCFKFYRMREVAMA